MAIHPATTASSTSNTVENIPSSEIFAKIQAVALPTIAFVAGIYFGLGYEATQVLMYGLLSSTLCLGSLQEILFELRHSFDLIDDELHHAMALAFCAVSLGIAFYYLLGIFASFEFIKVVAFSSHFFLAKKALDQLEGQNAPLVKRRFPIKKTYTPTHPKGLVNVDQASCFLSSIIKSLLCLPHFKLHLDKEITEGTERISLEDRKHIQQKMIILRDELEKPIPSHEVVSQAWYELRYENPSLLNLFPERQSSDALSFFSFIQQALGLLDDPHFSLESRSKIEIPGQSPLINPNLTPVPILNLSSIFSSEVITFFQLPEEISHKYADTQLKLRDQESEESLRKRQHLLDLIKSRPILVDDLIRAGYVNPHEKTIEEQLNDLLDFKEGESVQPIYHELRKERSHATVQELIENTFEGNAIHDYTDYRQRPFKKYDVVIQKTDLTHQNLADFQNLVVSIPVASGVHHQKSEQQISDPDHEIVLTVLDAATNTNKQVRLKLRSIVCHQGKNTQTGHFVSYVKEEDGWYLHDDAEVMKIEEGKLAEQFYPAQPHCHLNLLFYEVTGITP